MKNKLEKIVKRIEKRIENIEERLNRLENTKQKWIRIGQLEWLKDCSKKEMTWKEAKRWCKKQRGRLPTRLELLDLYDNHFKECEKLITDSSFYTFWSVTEYSAANAWSVTLNYGSTGTNAKTGTSQVCCVR